MNTFSILALSSTATLLFTGCITEETDYHHPRGAYYDEGPRYHERSDVVVYDDAHRHRDYDREVDRTNVYERNVYATNVHENGNARQAALARRRVVHQAQVPGKVVKKSKKKHDDHDQDHQ